MDITFHLLSDNSIKLFIRKLQALKKEGNVVSTWITAELQTGIKFSLQMWSTCGLVSVPGTFPCVCLHPPTAINPPSRDPSASASTSYWCWVQQGPLSKVTISLTRCPNQSKSSQNIKDEEIWKSPRGQQATAWEPNPAHPPNPPHPRFGKERLIRTHPYPFVIYSLWLFCTWIVLTGYIQQSLPFLLLALYRKLCQY